MTILFPPTTNHYLDIAILKIYGRNLIYCKILVNISLNVPVSPYIIYISRLVDIAI